MKWWCNNWIKDLWKINLGDVEDKITYFLLERALFPLPKGDGSLHKTEAGVQSLG